MRTKKLKFLAIILGFIMAIMPLTTTGCSLFGPSENDIEVVAQAFDRVSNGSQTNINYPPTFSNVVFALVKNKSSKNLTVKFYADIYLLGVFRGKVESYSTYIAAGKTERVEAYVSKTQYGDYTTGYTFKITSWKIS